MPTVKTTLISSGALVLAAAVTGAFTYLGTRGDATADQAHATASTTVSAAPADTHPAGNNLELALPGNGTLPWTHYVEVRVKNVSKQAFDEVQVGVHNQDDKEYHWNFYNCNATSIPTEFVCPEVVAGDYKNRDSKGPWTIAAVVVDSDGKKIITDNRPALVAANLLQRFGSTVKAYGTRDAHRE
jgi:hypothetical protein